MAITLRSDVNRPLTFAEVDANFNEIDTTTVKTTGNQTIAGTKTFSNGIVSSVTGSVTGNLTGNVTGNTSGNAGTASALESSRNITLSGAVTGTVGFNGTQNVTMTTQLSEPFVDGMIMMWSGTSANVPSGWALCDGANGTPNLVNKFIRGATTSGTTGGYADSIVVSHSHVGTTNTTGLHTHTATGTINLNVDNNGGAYPVRSSGTETTSQAGSHSHTVVIDSAGESGVGKNLPPYYELCYIIKV